MRTDHSGWFLGAGTIIIAAGGFLFGIGIAMEAERIRDRNEATA